MLLWQPMRLNLFALAVLTLGAATLPALGQVNFDIRKPDRRPAPRMLFRQGGVLSAPSGRDPEQIGRDFLRANRAAFSFRPDEVDGLRVVVKDVTPTVTFLAFNQTLDGIDVFNGQIKFTLNQSGEVVQ